MSKRKVKDREWTPEDTLKAAEAGEKAFEYWLETGKLMGVEDGFICDCMRNYGKKCLYPDKYRSGGCK